MKHAVLLATALACAPLAASAAAPICGLVAELDAWMAAETGLAPGMPCDRVDIGALPAGDGLRSQAGAYFPRTDRIALAADLDLSDPFGQSFLVHELVHRAQFQAGLQHRVRCEGELEAQAYRTQAAFLRARGLGREATMTGALGNMLGSCAE